MFVDSSLNRLFNVGVFALGTICVGTIGYTLLEGWSVFDSMYMTVITLSTVGYGEIHELTTAGRSFSTLLIFLSILTMTFLTATLTSFIVENDMGGHFIRRKIMKTISQLSGHTVICGAGSMAETVIERLMKKRKDVVVIDDDPRRLEGLRSRWRKLLTLEGDPTNEMTLAQANVLEAAHMIAALDSEMDNLLVAITCKDIRGDITVFANSNDVTIANRMRKAAVDEVISPSQLVGEHVANKILA